VTVEPADQDRADHDRDNHDRDTQARHAGVVSEPAHNALRADIAGWAACWATR